MDDKRRVPYNIWVAVVSMFIFFSIASIGVLLDYAALKAEVNTDSRIVFQDDYSFMGFMNSLVPVCSTDNCSIENVEIVYNREISLRYNSAKIVIQNIQIPLSELTAPHVETDQSANWQLQVIEYFALIVSVFFYMLAAGLAFYYNDTHWWDKGDFKKKKLREGK